MKPISIFLFSAGLGLACHTTAQDAKAVPGYVSYGAVISPDAPLSPAAFAKKIADSEEVKAKLQAEIITSCQKKGCWMDMKLQDGSSMKVRFADYAFFVPTAGLEGKTAIVEGTASREVITEAMRRHYAEDAGKSKEECESIKGDETKLTFLADGVLIKM